MKIFRIAAVLSLLGGMSFAQLSRVHSDIAIRADGRPAGGASIRVCTAAATGVPCSPLATIYSDNGLTTPKANPFTADSQGNYTYYAASAFYKEQVNVSGVVYTHPVQLTDPNVADLLALKADLSGGKVPQSEIATGDVTNSTLCIKGGTGFSMGSCGSGGGAGDATTIQGNGVTAGSVGSRPGAYYAVNSAQTALTLQDKSVYQTRDYGIASDTTTNDTVPMKALVSTIGAAQATVVLPKNSQTLLGSMVFPSNVTLDFSEGGALKPLTDSTVAGGGAIDTSGSGSSFSTSAASCAVTVTPTAGGESYWVYTVNGFASGAATVASSVATDGIPAVASYQSNTNVSMLSQGWIVGNVVAGARTFTFSYAGTGWVGCGAIAISGLGVTPAVGVTASAQGTASPMSSGAATVQAGSFVLGYGGQHNDTETCTAGAGFTQIANFGTGGTVCAEAQNSSSAGSLTVTQALSSAPTGLAWDFNLVELRPGSATIGVLGPVIAPPRKIFYNSQATQGTIDFTGNYALQSVPPEWWGASPSASAAVNTPAIQAAIRGAFGSNRTNGSGLAKYNRELHFSGLYDINDELKVYHMHGFRWTGGGRLFSGLRQTAANKRIIDGESITYGSFDQLRWETSASQNVPLFDLNYSTAQGTDLAIQNVTFTDNVWVGNGLGQIGPLISRTTGAQGDNIRFYNNYLSGFTMSCAQIGGNNTGLNTGRSYAQNALLVTFQGGDIQACPGYGIASYGGTVTVKDMTFQNDSAAFSSGGSLNQTGFDVYCEAPQGTCSLENSRSESHKIMAGGSIRMVNVFSQIQAAYWYSSGSSLAGTPWPVDRLITGTGIGGDGKYYKITVAGTFGGLGITSATSGSSTTIVNSGASYTVDTFLGNRAAIQTGTGNGHYCIVTGNTSTTITCAAGWVSNYAQLADAPPDATSTFTVEPNWGTQTTSGGVTFALYDFNAIEGSAGATGLADLQNVKIQGGRIRATGNFRDIFVTRTDWVNSGFPLDDSTTTSQYNNVQVYRPSAIAPTGYGVTKYISWAFPRNGSSQYSNYSQFNLGTLPIVWSGGQHGGGTRALDVWVGGRSDTEGTTSVSRSILETGGTLGRPTPFGTNQAGTDMNIQGGLSTGSGAPGNINFYMGAAGSSGTSVNAGTVMAHFTTSGLVFDTITGSAQCLHVNAAGLLSGTGSDCGSSGGIFAPGGSNGDVQYNNAGVLGGIPTSGSGNVVRATGASLATPSITSLTFPGIVGLIQCLHVDAVGLVTGTGSDCGAGAGGPSSIKSMSSYASAQAALTALASGQTLLVDGTFTLCNGTISTSNVKILGAGSLSGILQCATNNQKVLTVSGNGVTVQGVKFKHITNSPISGGDGLVIAAGTTNVRVIDNEIDKAYNGLNLGPTSFGIVEGNYIAGNNADGVVFTSDGSSQVMQWRMYHNISLQNLGAGFNFTLGAAITGLQTTCPTWLGDTAYGNVSYGFKISASAATTSGISDCFFGGESFASFNNNSGFYLDAGPNGGRNNQWIGGFSELSGQYASIAGFNDTVQTATNVGHGLEITSSCDPTISPQVVGMSYWQNSYSGAVAACTGTQFSAINAYKNGLAGSANSYERAAVAIRASQISVLGGYFRDNSSKMINGVDISNSADKITVQVNCETSVATCVQQTTTPTNLSIILPGSMSVTGSFATTGTAGTGTVRSTWLLGDQGTAQTSGNITITGWGSGAAKSAVTGYAQRFEFTVTAGTTPSANPTVVATFPDTAPIAPICYARQTGGNDVISDLTSGTESTTSTGTLTWIGTPTNTKTYSILVDCR